MCNYSAMKFFQTGQIGGQKLFVDYRLGSLIERNCYFLKEVVGQLPATVQQPDDVIIRYVDQNAWTHTSS